MAAELGNDATLAKVLWFLDRHLALAVLEFLQAQNVVEESSLLRQKDALLRRTNLVDFTIDVHQCLHCTSSTPPELSQQRERVLSRLNELQQAAQKIVNFLSNPSLVSQLRGDKHSNLKLLHEHHDIGLEDIESLYRYARFQFECGNYEAAAELLYHYRSLCTDYERSFSALWGKLASDILMQDWESALDDIKRLHDAIDGKQHSSVQMQLQQQVWLMHWSLFVYFNHERGRDALIDLFMQDRYLSAIQACAPHLLRYLAVAAVTCRRGHAVAKELVTVFGQDRSDIWSDPAPGFLHALFLDCDFKKAERKLNECDTVLENDFFTVGCKREFLDSALLFILERYCTIHRALSIETLADKLHTTQDEAERWVISLIKQGRLDARVDSERKRIEMDVKRSSICDTVREKARPLAERTRNLVLALNTSGSELQS